MKKNRKILIAVILLALFVAAGGWFAFRGAISPGNMPAMPPVQAALPQDPAGYGAEEHKILETSRQFWSAMEQADEEGMRRIADPNSTFVHIGMTCKLDEEIRFYTEGLFQPTDIAFHDQSVEIFGDTAIVITDCDYSLNIGDTATTHHFAVTEVYVNQNDDWRLIQFTFTSLVS